MSKSSKTAHTTRTCKTKDVQLNTLQSVCVCVQGVSATLSYLVNVVATNVLELLQPTLKNSATDFATEATRNPPLHRYETGNVH